MHLLEGLNPEQKKAVLHREGPLLILAGAGSGKTRVLTHRIGYMIEQGISPYNILAITFTNKAAKEMKERINNISSEGEKVWVNTFHATCIRILRMEIEYINFNSNFSVYDSDDSERIIKKCLKFFNLDDKLYKPKTIKNYISSWKDEGKRAKTILKEVGNDYRLKKIAEIYELYEKALITNNALDFDDIILACVELFTKNEKVLEKYQKRFEYVMVDEYQDTNMTQYELIRLLSKKHKNLCVVGDDDQSIYGWRGANIRNILEFENDYKNTIVIKLEQNYRSTQTILDSANKVISNNRNRKDKKLWTEQHLGEKINYYRAKNEPEESKFIVNKIEKMANNNYKDFAVLYRTNAQSRAVEEQLVKNNIPYKLFGGVRFYDRKEIKDIISYLKFINNPKDDMALTRIINVPKRGIGDTTFTKLINYAAKNNVSIFEGLQHDNCKLEIGIRSKKIDKFIIEVKYLIEFSKNNPVSSLLNKIMSKIEYLEYLKSEYEDEIELDGRLANINQLKSKINEFEETSEEKTLSLFLGEVSLVADIDEYDEDADKVMLMTLHSSKGLEFPCVFLIGFEETIFPSFRAIISGEDKDLEEERRLCYVGITRAKNILYLTSACSRLINGKTVYNSVSRFFKEIPENLIHEIEKENTISRNISFKESKSTYISNSSTGKIIGLGEKAEDYLGNDNILKPKNVNLEFKVSDNVKIFKYGIGRVTHINPAGADYEVTVEFEHIGTKKFMAGISKLKKV